MSSESTLRSEKGNPLALLPLLLFVLIYLGAGIAFGDFYQLPVPVVFLLTAVIGLLQFPSVPFALRLQEFCRGAGHSDLMLMCLIFILAGAFGQLSKDIGAVDSVVQFALHYLSPGTFVAGLFVIAAFISLSLGTSVGTIAAVTPIAAGLSQSVPDSLAPALAAVIGGAMFGDNLSFISDTTIAATRTQGVNMRDKFRLNVMVVLPAALLTIALYIFYGTQGQELPAAGVYDLLTMLPYAVIFVLALCGLNVLWTLVCGILLSLALGMYRGSLLLLQGMASVNTGMAGMYELCVICILIGGITGLISYHGGIQFLLQHLDRHSGSPRRASLGIAALAAGVNACLANNTIAILITGPVAREIAVKNNVDLRKSASILDTITCSVQGLLPYGAQVLTALTLAGFAVPASELIAVLYYPLLTGLSTLLFILLFNHKKGMPGHTP